MPLFQSATDKATGDLKKLREQKAKFEQQIVAVESELLFERNVSGEQTLDELLDGRAKPGESRERVRKLEAELEDLTTARRVLLGRIRAAILAVGRAQADEKRGEAKKREAERTKHDAETQRLLKPLEEHTGVAWVMKDQFIQIAGPALGSIYGDLPIPKLSESTKLRAMIAALESEAKAIEDAAAEQAAGGRAQGETLEQLLAAAAAHPLGPTASEVRAWHSRAVVRADADWARNQGTWSENPLRGPTRFMLAWDGNGEIDEARSTATNSHTSQPLPLSQMPVHAPVSPPTQ